MQMHQLFRIMKLSFILLFVSFVSLSASVLGQNDMITYSGNAVKVSEVLDYIEQNTDFTIAYSSEYIDLNREVTVKVKNEKVKYLLEDVFEGTSIAVKVTEDKILLFNKEVQQQGVRTKSISGVISDDRGEVIPGASVLVKGTTIGTITDLDGKFTLSDVPEDAIIIVSFIGMKTQELSVVGKMVFNVALTSDVIGLDEIVSVGYGSKKKANLTGAVGNVQMTDMESRPLTNASLALQGTVAGVYALQSSGKPGDDNAVIDIRGVGTFGDNSPLILIDGFPGSMSDVNSNDIKSISVLKDAASASIYGNRAANGVILITTKKGAPGQMKVSYNGYFGVQEPTRLPDVLNSVEYVTLHREASENSGRVQTYSLDDLAKYEAGNDPMYPDIDYFDVYYGSASTQNHRLTMSGGTEKLHYAFMVGRLDQDGIMVATNYKKTDFRSNIDAYFLKDNRLRLSSKLSGNLGVKGEPTSVWNATWYATLAPIYPLKNADGQYMTVNGELNPYASIKAGSTSETKRYNFNGQVEAEYTILDGLSAQLTYGYNVVDQNRNSFNANNVLYNKDGSTKTESSDLTVANDNDIQTLLTALIKYNKTIGMHQITALAGYSEEEFTWDWQSGYRKNFVNNDQRVLSLGDAATQTNDAGS